ncbi:MAG: DUF4406 domain-containing protein [Treponema sp.]|jgi:hypothetical protein|nr:DUF4406 domain-containing protein [Treponema sp.]
MKSIYLCGPVSGRTIKETAGHFLSVEETIRRAMKNSGRSIIYVISNPLRFCSPDSDWRKAMRDCVRELADCGGIALLQGWQKSKGAAIELKLAQDLHIPVVYIEPPVDSLDLTELFTAAPEALRYYIARLAQFHNEGTEESLAENRAVVELTNRFLDPYGFEYIDIEEGE